MTVAKGYALVNSAWPEQMPDLSFEEGRRATKLLWRAFVKQKFPWPIKESQGKLFGTWLRRRKWFINPRTGWHDLVHAVSHKANRRICPAQKFHSGSHAFMEREMIKYALDHGWLDGRLKAKPKADAPDIKTVRYQQVLDRLAKWEQKLKRAQTAIKKLERKRAYYEKRAA